MIERVFESVVVRGEVGSVWVGEAGSLGCRVCGGDAVRLCSGGCVWAGGLEEY